ncbi:MAG: hypothetical protein ACRDOI_09285 [Trebonia sp.]
MSFTDPAVPRDEPGVFAAAGAGGPEAALSCEGIACGRALARYRRQP